MQDTYMLNILLAFLPLLTGYSTNLTCKKQSDCNERESPQCSLCVDDVISGSGHCFYPFPYMFESGKKCNFLSKCINNCSNVGECLDDPGFVPNCFCEKDYHNYYCQNRTGEENAGVFIGGLRWTFDGMIPPGVYKNVNFTVFLHYNFRRSWIKNGVSQYFLQTDDGYYQSHFDITDDRKCGNERCFASQKDYSPQIRFPFKYYNDEKNKHVLKFGNEVLGYLSNMRLTAVTNGMEDYRNNFPVLVSYQEAFLKCIAVFKLTNCVPTAEIPTTFTRLTYIQIESNVNYVADGRYIKTSFYQPDCASSAIISWKVWKLEINQTETSHDPMYQQYKYKTFSFAPYSLDFGSYKVLLEVKNVQVSGVSINFAYCYIKIKSTPLVAIIDGGNDRKVYKQSNLMLSARHSNDPNMPPSKQDHVFLVWSCVSLLEPKKLEGICAPKEFKVGERYYISSEKLTYNAVYNFTLKVWTNRYDQCEECDSVSPKFAYLRIEVASETEKAPEDIYIECVKNCREKVAINQLLYIKAKTTHQLSERNDYEWTYHKSKEIDKPVDSIKIQGLPSHLLLVKEGSLKSGTRYTIVVRVISTGWFAKYSFETDEMVYDGFCSVQPKSGIKGYSSFDIVCSSYAGSTFIYEFYDKSSKEAHQEIIYNGRMLGTSHTGQLFDVRLTRGYVLVYIYNNNGLFIRKKTTVNLSNWNITAEVMNGIYKNLTEIVENGDISRALRYISFVPDVVSSDVDKSIILKTLLHSFVQISVSSIADVKLSTLTLNNVLVTLNEPTQLGLKPKLLEIILGVIYKLANIFKYGVYDREHSQWMTPQEVKQVGIYILNCLHAVLLCKDESLVGVAEDDFDLHVLNELRQGSIFAEDTIDCVKDILSYIQSPAQPPTKISSTSNAFVVWVMESSGKYHITSLLERDKDIPLNFPNTLVNKVERHMMPGEELNLQLTVIDQNIFWWCISEVKSNLVSISLAKRFEKEMLRPIKTVDAPLDILISLDNSLVNTKVTNSTTQLDPRSSVVDLDLGVRIHRLDPAPRSVVSITFLFPSTNVSLRVLVMEHFRPDYEMMTQKSRLITRQTPTYLLSFYNHDEPVYLYIGIIPGPEVPVNQSVTYSFEVNTTLCQLWKRGQWSSLNCQIGPDTKGKDVHCQCTHFTIFAAAFPVPPQEIDPFTDIKLFVTVVDNPLVVAYVIAVFIIYLLWCVWAWFKDRHDRCLRNMIILNDNFPKDHYPYLLAVYTSSRFNAGTTANVGFKLIGTTANSRCHIFSSKDRKVLRRSSDDWFLIFCPEPLGELQGIHLWHDNSGQRPEWFCDKIHVYDLRDRTETMFVIAQWLALNLKDYPEATVVPARARDVMSIKKVFLDNCMFGLRDNHSLFSIILRHPRSHLSRVQRISILMCFFLVAMLCSIMFYIPEDDKRSIDYPHFEIGSRQVYISLQSLIISGAVTYILLFSFRRSYKPITYTRHRSTLLLREEKFFEYMSIPYGTTKKRSSNLQLRPGSNLTGTFLGSMPKSRHKVSCFQNLIRLVSKMMESQPLEPVHPPYCEQKFKLRKRWFIIAWLYCIVVIIVCSYLVMLYGLKLGLVQCKEWLSTVLFTMGEDIFITGPARVIILSSVLSLAFQRVIEVNTHCATVNSIMVLRPPNDIKYIENILIKRNNQMYAPLSTDLRRAMLSKIKLQSKWWTFVNFILSACFVAVVSTMINNLWTSHYDTSNHIKKLLTFSHDPYMGYVNFYDVKNISGMKNYLKMTFMEAMYNLKWYNGWRLAEGEDDEKKYWATDFTNRMIGLPVVRQLRIVPTNCKTIILKRTKCIPHWSETNADTDIYGVGWSTAEFDDVAKNNSPWKYTERTTSVIFSFYRLYGKSGILYDNGGYKVELGPTRQQTERMLAELSENSWQDLRTSVVFVELTLYNVNTDLYSQVTLFVEYFIAGTILLNAHVFSVENRLKDNIWNVIFTIFIFYYFLKNAYSINQHGLLEYISATSNIWQLFLTAVGILTIVIFTLHYYYSALYSKSFEESHQDSYFDFDVFTFLFIQLQTLLFILLCITITCMIILLRFGRPLLAHYYAFKLSMNWIFWLTVIVILLFTVQFQIAIFLNMFTSYNYKEFVRKDKLISYLNYEQIKNTPMKMFCIINKVPLTIFFSFFIILFKYYAKAAKVYKLKPSDNFNYITLLATQLTKQKKRRNYN